MNTTAYRPGCKKHKVLNRNEVNLRETSCSYYDAAATILVHSKIFTLVIVFFVYSFARLSNLCPHMNKWELLLLLLFSFL